MENKTPHSYQLAKLSFVNHYKSANPIEIQNKIRNFRKLDFKNISDKDLFSEICKVLCINGRFIYPANIRVTHKDVLFYRVRKLNGNFSHIENFRKISDMWEPPKDRIKVMGRLNKPGESLLYTTPCDPNIAIKEARIQENDLYSLIKYSARDNIKVNVIGGEFDMGKIGLKDENSILAFNLINDFLRDEFSRDVGKGTEFLYRISERIAKDYFDGPPRTAQDAWAYCSMIDKNKHNICFRPEIAHDLLELHGAMICIKEKTDNIKPILVATPSKENDSIEYYNLGSKVQKEIFPEIIVENG